MSSEAARTVDGLAQLAHKRVQALYRCDRRGRLVSINAWDGAFFHSAICRCRADLPEDLVKRLGELCAREH
jgi:hypothetical protein